jgi:hypothetical protein
LSSPINAGDLGSPDLIFYEIAVGVNIQMDWVEVRIANDLAGPWYTVLYWGDGNPDINTNISAYAAGGENDNEIIPQSAPLYGTPPFQTGITIDVDGAGVPAGTYQYLLVVIPMGGMDGDGQCDSIEILP